MSNKGRSILGLVMVLFLVSLACNLPLGDQLFGAVLCLLTGGTWVEQTDGYGMCVKEPTEYAEKPASEEVVTSEEMIPQTDENTIQEQPTEPLTEDVVAPDIDQSSVNAPTEKPADREETPDESLEEKIPGNWSGTSEYDLVTDASCQLTLITKADGSLTTTEVCVTPSQPDWPQTSGSATGHWSLSDDKITLTFDGSTVIWSGTFSDDRMNGTITGIPGGYEGVWSLTKQE